MTYPCFDCVGQCSGFIKPSGVEIAQALEPGRLKYPQPRNLTAAGFRVSHLHLSGPSVPFAKNNRHSTTNLVIILLLLVIMYVMGSTVPGTQKEMIKASYFSDSINISNKNIISNTGNNHNLVCLIFQTLNQKRV